MLQKLGITEKPIAARDGRWFTVRIMPYRTLDDRIDGVVITFADITAAKALEAQLREKHAALEKLLANQSRETNPAGDKAMAKPVAAKRTRIPRRANNALCD